MSSNSIYENFSSNNFDSENGTNEKDFRSSLGYQRRGKTGKASTVTAVVLLLFLNIFLGSVMYITIPYGRTSENTEAADFIELSDVQKDVNLDSVSSSSSLSSTSS